MSAYFLLMFWKLICFSVAFILILELLCSFLRTMSFSCWFTLDAPSSLTFCFKPLSRKIPFQMPSPVFCHQPKLPALISKMYISKTVWSKIVSVSWNCFPFLCHPHNHPGFYFVLQLWFSLFLILINALWEQGSNNNKMPFFPLISLFFSIFLCFPRSNSQNKSPSTRHAFC